MREAVVYAFALLRVKGVFVDEAQHLMSVDTPHKPTSQLDWLKALTNRTNVLHVLAGNFDLYDFCRVERAANRDPVGDQIQTAKIPKCTFSGVVVPIDLKRFLDSDVALVECPDCASTRTLEPHGGVLRFKSHDKRKTTTPHTERRWAAKGEMDWDVVGS